MGGWWLFKVRIKRGRNKKSICKEKLTHGFEKKGEIEKIL